MGEKPSFLLFVWTVGHHLKHDVHLRHQYSLALFKTIEKVMLSLSSARELAAITMQNAPKITKLFLIVVLLSTFLLNLMTGLWYVFPRRRLVETGNCHRHGMSCIKLLQSLTLMCMWTKSTSPRMSLLVFSSHAWKSVLLIFQAVSFWYGRSRRGPGRPPKWAHNALEALEEDTGCQDKSKGPLLLGANSVSREEPQNFMSLQTNVDSQSNITNPNHHTLQLCAGIPSVVVSVWNELNSSGVM